MRQLLNGAWPDEECLVVQHGQTIQLADVTAVIRAGE